MHCDKLEAVFIHAGMSMSIIRANVELLSRPFITSAV